MVKALLKGGILGGLIIFMWSAVSWMLIPWHMSTFSNFKQGTDTAVNQMITSNATQSGIYTLPNLTNQSEPHDCNMKGPFVFTVVHLEDKPGMVHLMLNELLIQLVAAFLITAIMLKVNNMSYISRVSCIALFGLAAGITTSLPLWNWFGFPLSYVTITILDLFISWSLAGFAIAWATKK